MAILFCKAVFFLSFYLADLSCCEAASLSVGRHPSSTSEVVLKKGFASSSFKISGCILRTILPVPHVYGLWRVFEGGA